MDRFLANKSKVACHVSAQQRHFEFSSWTHVSGGKLFCTSCNLVVDHTRKSSVESHSKTEKHKNSLKRMKEGDTESRPAKKQRTINLDPLQPQQTISSQERNDLCKEIVSVFASANIPLSKVDHPAVRNFLQKRVENGGAVPHSKQLQECYLLRELEDSRKLVRKLVENKPIAVICDEMSDKTGRFVFNILVAPLQPLTENCDAVKSFLLDTIFLSSTNSATVSAAIVECLVANGLRFSDVVTVNTDNASYMKKAYNTVLKGLMPNSTHVTCMAHIMNLLGEAFRKPFKRTNTYIKAANAIFWNAGARKARYIRFLSQLMTNPKMPPNPVGTRWNCWFDAVQYHRDHLQHFHDFIKEEVSHCGRLAPESLTSLEETLLCPAEVSMLEAEMSFILEHCELFVKATDVFQSQKPIAVKAHSRLEELKYHFDSCGITLAQAERHFPDAGLEQTQKLELQDKFCQAFCAVNQKLEKYMSSEGQPGISFIKQLPFFDPKNLILFDDNDLTALPGLKDVPATQIKRYKESLGPMAVKVSGSIPIDLTVFWNSVSSEVPELAECARKYIYTCLNSADAERSFSLYNLVFSERRRSLKEENLKALVFLYYNNFISYESLL